MVWDSTDPDGYLDGATFSKGTNAHHAIELTSTTGGTYTFRDVAFSGFNASDNQNDSTILVDAGYLENVTINLVGCSGNISYKNTTGANVTLVTDPRTLTIEVRDEAGTLITDATEVTIVRTSDTTVLHHAESVTTGSTAYQYTYTSDVATYVNVLVDPTAGNYVAKTVEPVTLINADQTVVVQLAADRAYSNP